ncbi:MAG: menaquinone-dependent protoporphyrinogen IX dehydrogenase [Chitinophagales bacterium]|nr:menaquinone-dependent protoporphyrinogen IX dehydrogenase [Chitinophagales bacterium]
MKILIVYGTTEGQTQKIATFLKDEAITLGHSVKLVNALDEQPSPEGYNMVFIGASLHAGGYQAAIRHYVQQHAETLNQLYSVFFSVSLTAAGDDQESWKELEEITTEFLHKTGWKPNMVKQIAGALKYTQYDFFKRFIMRMISKRAGGATDTGQDYEYTDWELVKAFLKDALGRYYEPAKQVAL